MRYANQSVAILDSPAPQPKELPQVDVPQPEKLPQADVPHIFEEEKNQESEVKRYRPLLKELGITDLGFEELIHSLYQHSVTADTNKKFLMNLVVTQPQEFQKQVSEANEP
jgi:hypothetical protein